MTFMMLVNIQLPCLDNSITRFIDPVLLLTTASQCYFIFTVAVLMAPVSAGLSW